MSEGIFREITIFVQSFLAGVAVILAYDALRIIRRIIKHNVVVLAVQDLLYWVGCAFFIFQILFRINDGVIRWFSISGIALGMLVYNFSISAFLVKHISGVINKVLEIIYKILNLISKPFRWVFKKIFGFIRVLLKKIIKFSKYMKKRLKYIYKEVKILLSKH